MTSRHPIPDAALDDCLGFLGMTGSGKTFGAGTCIERILAKRGASSSRTHWESGGACGNSPTARRHRPTGSSSSVVRTRTCR
jgi:hypothetical protein